MRYISDDGKIFNSEIECTNHENNLKKKKEEEKRKLEEERIRKEKLENKRRERFESIKKHQEELNKEIQSYQKDYGCMILIEPVDFVLRELFR